LGSNQVFAAVADPTRRAILTLLREQDELAVGDIAINFPEMTRAAVSAHLRVLRTASLVSEQRRGQHRIYKLGDNKADDVIRFLMSVYADGVEEFVRNNNADD
jgi:DNA-binding transcriptional ArsR family regulator